MDLASWIADVSTSFIARDGLLSSTEHVTSLSLEQTDSWGVGIEQVVVAQVGDCFVQGLPTEELMEGDNEAESTADQLTSSACLRVAEKTYSPARSSNSSACTVCSSRLIESACDKPRVDGC
jgi:hypothetical protein